MEPKIKTGLRSTYHRDGTVSYWSVHLQQWVREDAAAVSDRDLVTLSPEERARIARHAEIPHRCR